MSYRLRKGFIIQKFAKKTTIFDSEKSVLYTFNETSSFIFQNIKLGLDEKRISRALAEKYGIDLKTAGRDTKLCISILNKKGIIVTA